MFTSLSTQELRFLLVNSPELKARAIRRELASRSVIVSAPVAIGPNRPVIEGRPWN